MKTITLQLNLVVLALVLSINAYTQTCPGSPGCLDPTFGSGGMNVISPPLADDPLYNSALDMVFQNDGKIMILARAKDAASSFQTVLVRFTVDGQLDASFATGGFLYIPAEAYPATFARRLPSRTLAARRGSCLPAATNAAQSTVLRCSVIQPPAHWIRVSERGA